jgi:hypothetical protein
MFRLNRTGSITKNIKEGITIQNIPCDNWAIFIVSLVSIYNQINANNDTNGIEAMMLPNSVLRFAISVMATIVTDDNNILII